MSKDKYNVPGAVEYHDTLPIDVVLRSDEDQKLRGYWLGRASDGQLCLVSNQNDADHVLFGQDGDGTQTVRYTDITTEFSYDGIFTVRLERYS